MRWSRPPLLPIGLALVPLANLLMNGLAVVFAPENRPAQLFDEYELITWLDSAELFVAGLLSCAVWELSPTSPQRRSNRFWLLTGLFLIYLSADEFLQIHDQLGAWLEHHTLMRAPRGIGTLDNAILLLYFVLAAGLATAYRRRLLASRLTLGILLIAGLVMAASETADLLTTGILFRKTAGLAFRWSQVIEESLKFLGSGFILAAVLAEYARCILSDLSVRLPQAGERPPGPGSSRLS